MTDTAVATAAPKQQHPLVVLRERLESRFDEIKAALPSDISPQAFIRAAMTSAQITPEILACSWQSIWTSCMRACRDGLLPDGVEGAIVPYKSTATWIPMYQGQLRRFRRSGQFRWITADVVREGEEFHHYVDELGEHFKHVPGDNFDAPIVKVYAIATTLDGGVFCTVLTIAEANKIRAMSKASRDDSPWKQWPTEMYKKTALRRLSKLLPNARDIIGDDDLQIDDAPAAAPVASIPRAPGAAAALEQFASAPVESRTPTGPGGEPDGTATDAADAVSAAHAAEDSHPAAAGDDENPLELAYALGKEAKAAGVQRRAIPPEYRASDRTREALAWQAGHDGTEMPTFDKQATGERK